MYTIVSDLVCRRAVVGGRGACVSIVLFSETAEVTAVTASRIVPCLHSRVLELISC